MKRAILPSLIDGIDLLSESLIIRIPSDRLLALLDEDACPPVVGPVRGEAGPVVTLTVPVRLKRAGRETRLIIDGADADARRDPVSTAEQN